MKKAIQIKMWILNWINENSRYKNKKGMLRKLNGNKSIT